MLVYQTTATPQVPSTGRGIPPCPTYVPIPPLQLRKGWIMCLLEEAKICTGQGVLQDQNL